LPNTDGRSRVPDILAAARGEPAADDALPAFAFLDQNWGKREIDAAPTVAVAVGRFRYVMAPSQHGKVGAPTLEVLFDAEADARELESVLETNPELAARFREMVERHLATEPAPWGVDVPTLEIDEIRLQQLRALGYKVP
jgi:hypothetical protein